MASSGKTNSNIAHLTPADIAKWPHPNYVDPETIPWLPVYSSVWFAAATILFGMRCWLRLRGHAGRLGLDDAILFPGWLAGLMFTAISIIYTDYAHGDRHVWDAPPDKRTTLVLCMCILLFYRRLVNGTYSTRYKWLIWTAIAFTIAYTFAFCVMLLANCTPTRAYWMAFDIRYALTEDYTCLDTSIINTMAGVCAAISDVYSVVLPCILTWKLKSVPKAQKIALFGIFSLGLVIVGVGGVRTYWLIETGTSKDITRSAFNLFIWAQIELQAGIMCASAPALRVFFRRYLGNSVNSRKTRNISTAVSGKSTHITVKRDTRVTYEQDSSESTESLTNRSDKSPAEPKPTWSPIHTDGKSDTAIVAETRYSHEEESFGMVDLGWKTTNEDSKWGSQA